MEEHPEPSGVVLAWPHANHVTHGFMQSVLQSQVRYPDLFKSFTGQRCYPGDDLALGRNRICTQFLSYPYLPPPEWLWMVDTDISFPVSTLPKMIRTADAHTRDDGTVPVVSGHYNINTEAHHYNSFESQQYTAAWDWRSTGGLNPVSTTKLTEQAPHVGATGAGCLLIHRSVLLRLERDWFTVIRTGGISYGEDISFCRRLAETGIPLILDNTAVVHHLKEQWI